MWNFGSTSNVTFINQGNMQIALNLAVNSPGAFQSLGQFATNNAVIYQIG
jgi:hypothetical protein